MSIIENIENPQDSLKNPKFRKVSHGLRDFAEATVKAEAP